MRHNYIRKHLKQGQLRILGLVLYVAIAVLAVACYPRYKENKDVENQIELTFFYPVEADGPVAGFIEEMAKDFNQENPDIKIKPVYSDGYEEIEIQRQEAIEKGTPPDLFVDLASKRYEMVENGQIEPLCDLIKADGGEEYITGFLDEFIVDSYVDDKIYGIPFQRSVEILYYNKDAFEEVGLNPDKPPRTWEQLIRYSKKLTKRDRRGNVERWGVGMPLNLGAAQWTFGSFASQNNLSGGNLMSEDGKSVYFDTPENVEVLEFWADLRNEHQVMPANIIRRDDLPKGFLNGDYAMIYNTTGNLTNIYKNARFEFGIAFLPSNKQMGSTIGGGNFYITKGLAKEKQEAAWKFIRYATSTTQATNWAVNTGYIATKKDAHNTHLLEKYYEELPQALIGVEQLNYAKPELATYEANLIWDILNSNIQFAVNGDLEADEALKKAQQQADKILDKYK
ncbi:MAG: ABC transporter substrate-binding protein [Epulopiscium sp.]|nr:ABC transporter substrate-binding protein [Candidatus Epulonipiscium sp.]